MSLASRPLYRARQFFEALRPRIDGDLYAEATALLGPELTPLFDSMAPRDRVHCLEVYRRLAESGCDNPDTLVAALLHDCGKGALSGATVRLWHRVAYVLLAAAAPPLLDRAARGRGGLAAIHRHAETGARLAQEMGAPERVVHMIAEHERREHDDASQQMLRAADDES